MANKDLSRELIRLSRQGGTLLRDRVRAASKTLSDAAPKRKSSKGLGKSNSLPALSQAAKSNYSTRMGGGWSTGNPNDDLGKVREKVEEILLRKGNLDYCEGPFFRTALWEAAWKNHAGIVRLLAARGASVCQADYQGRTPLHEAAFYGHADLADLLIDSGHPVDCADDFGQTPLFRAVESGRADVARRLLERGADASRLDSDSVTVQHIAAFKGLPTLSHELLCKGAVKNRFTITEHAGHQRTLLRAGSSLVLGKSKAVDRGWA